MKHSHPCELYSLHTMSLEQNRGLLQSATEILWWTWWWYLSPLSASGKCHNLTTVILPDLILRSWLLWWFRVAGIVYMKKIQIESVWKDLTVTRENCSDTCMAVSTQQQWCSLTWGFPCRICFAAVRTPLQYPLSVVFARYEGRSPVKENTLGSVFGLISHAVFLLSPFRQVVR